MRPFRPLRPRPDAPLPRANPVAKLGAAALLMAVLFVSVDALTPAIVLVGLVAAIALSGITLGALALRTWPILVGALAIGLLNAAFAGVGTGAEPVRIGSLMLSAEGLAVGLALGLRVVAIALSGVMALVTTDPTDLAGSLVQQLRVSPRFAVGALAAARLLPILAGEWQTLSMARRARGVAAGRSPVAALRIFFGQLLALLVAAIRRATRLAVAMESRGLGARPCRTAARPQRMRAADWRLLGAAALLGAGAIAVSAVAGSWRFIFG